PPTEHLTSEGDVAAGALDVACLDAGGRDGHGFADGVPDAPDHGAKAGAGAAGEVHRDPRSDVRLGGADRRVDGVIDEREVAHLPSLAVERERPAGRAASIRRWIAMSGRWRGPYTVK